MCVYVGAHRPAQNITFLMGLCPRMKNEWNKWKNHFYEMKGVVGMSGHEKEREQEDAYNAHNKQSKTMPPLRTCIYTSGKIISMK